MHLNGLYARCDDLYNDRPVFQREPDAATDRYRRPEEAALEDACICCLRPGRLSIWAVCSRSKHMEAGRRVGWLRTGFLPLGTGWRATVKGQVVWKAQITATAVDAAAVADVKRELGEATARRERRIRDLRAVRFAGFGETALGKTFEGKVFHRLDGVLHNGPWRRCVGDCGGTGRTSPPCGSARA